MPSRAMRRVTLASSLREQNIAEVDALADAIAASIVAS